MGERMWRDGPRLMTERAVTGDGAAAGADRRGGAADRAADRSGERAGIARDGGEAGAAGRAPGRTGRSVRVHLGESPLAWLKARGHIDGRQYDAGEMLRGDWERAGLSPRVTMRWDAMPGGRGGRAAPDPVIGSLSAKERFDAAVTAVGPGLSDVLWRVVCAGEGLAIAEKALGWPSRAGKLVLGLALDRLASHYRMR